MTNWFIVACYAAMGGLMGSCGYGVLTPQWWIAMVIVVGVNISAASD